MRKIRIAHMLSASPQYRTFIGDAGARNWDEAH